MTLPKFVAAGVCAIVLGAQLRAMLPISPDVRAWYWPFLPYPMYSRAHQRSDSLVVTELRVGVCGSRTPERRMTAEEIGIPGEQLSSLLGTVAHVARERRGLEASSRLSRAIDAEFPGRFCTASVWLRVVYVADTSTHRVLAPMWHAGEWSVNAPGAP